MYRIKLVILLLVFFVSTTLEAQKYKKREFRGVWIQTVFQSEYALMSDDEMKADFISKLDVLSDCGFNALVFQVRSEADAWYESEFEPWSRFCTGLQGKPRAFDPMSFLIRECHNRGMEFHAWINPYRAGASGISPLSQDHIYYKHPDWFVLYNNKLYFDPGNPQCAKYICKIVYDIVGRYDIDAIHLDDYFYPYPIKGIPFPDDKSFELYGKKFGSSAEARDNWRRDNVNKLVAMLKKTISSTKKWVRFGISPFGIYRNLSSSVVGSLTYGTQNYDDLYADVLYWTNNKLLDYIVPQIYWELDNKAAPYSVLLPWWSKNIKNCQLYIGQDVARTMNVNELSMKMNMENYFDNIKGNCFWPANEVLWNTGGVKDSLKSNYYRYPAIIPAFSNIYDGRPDKVKKLKYSFDYTKLKLEWLGRGDKKDPRTGRTFVVYRFPFGVERDFNNPKYIYKITPFTEIDLAIPSGKKDYYYVTSLDRFYNESKYRKIKIRRKKILRKLSRQR